MDDVSRSRVELEAECSRLRERIQEYETLLGGLEGPRSSIAPASLKQLIELVPAGIAVLTPELEWLAVNRYVCEITGIDENQLHQMRWSHLVRRYRLERPRDLIRRIGEIGPEQLVFDATRRHGDGGASHLEVIVRRVGVEGVLPECVLVVVKDVTVRVDALAAARQSAVFLRQVVDMIPHFVFAKDSQGRFLLVNRAVAEAYGSSPIVMLGKKDGDFCATPEEAQRFRADDLEVLRNGRPLVVSEEPLTDVQGRRRLLQTTKIPFCFGPEQNPGVLGVAVDVTALRSAEEQLRRRNVELDQFFEVALDLLCIADTSGRFRRVNREWERTLGYPKEELEGARFLDFVHPDDLESTTAAVRDLAEQRQVLNFVNRYRCRDGSYRFIEWRSVPVGDRIFAAARDITAHRDVEEALRKSRHMLENVLHHFPGVVFWKDLGSVYLGCNLAFAVGAGLAGVEEIVGKTDYDLPWAATEADAYRADDREVMSTGRPKLAIVEPQRQADGSVTWFNTTKVPLTDADGGVIGVLGVAADITEIRKLEDQYRQAQKMEAVGQLASGVAHDFNNILQVITGYVDLGQRRVAVGQGPELELEEIGRAALRAATLVRQLLTLSRQQTMQREVVEVEALVTSVGSMLTRLIEEWVDLRITLHGPLPAIWADPAQVEQVVVNLCVNARDAMPRGGALCVDAGVRELTADECSRLPGVQPGPYVVLTVSDSGTGIAPENLDRIFDPFFTTKEQGKGTGLGLATVYSIVRQHGGFVEVESSLGLGTTFRVHLPALGSESTLRGSATAVGGSDRPGGKETILVAEDDDQVRGLTVEVLRSAGYRVLVARDGEEALELIQTCGSEVELFVLDAVMPKISGRALRDAIRTRFTRAKILFCTGHSPDTLAPEGLDPSGVRVLAKPVSARALLEAVRRVLDDVDPLPTV